MAMEGSKAKEQGKGQHPHFNAKPRADCIPFCSRWRRRGWNSSYRRLLTPGKVRGVRERPRKAVERGGMYMLGEATERAEGKAHGTIQPTHLWQTGAQLE